LKRKIIKKCLISYIKWLLDTIFINNKKEIFYLYKKFKNIKNKFF
jgi:hypothetical protein